MEPVIKIGSDPNLERIDTLYAFIVTSKGKEGIMSIGDSPETQRPLVFGDRKIAEIYKSEIFSLADQFEARVKLVTFVREDARN